MRRDDTLQLGEIGFLHNDWVIEHQKRDTCVLADVHYWLGHVILYYRIFEAKASSNKTPLEVAVEGPLCRCTETRNSVRLLSGLCHSKTLRLV